MPTGKEEISSVAVALPSSQVYVYGVVPAAVVISIAPVLAPLQVIVVTDAVDKPSSAGDPFTMTGRVVVQERPSVTVTVNVFPVNPPISCVVLAKGSFQR